MNITDLIVELLEQGQRVEIPGIGTLDNVSHEAHHDPRTSTFYPASRTVAYSEQTSGDDAIVGELARRECVSDDVARQMWLNYVDALADKLKRSGEHTFGRLGKLQRTPDKGFGFAMAEGVVLGNDNDAPIEEVKIYGHEGEADPFAQFEVEEVSVTPVEATEPEPQPEPEPAQPEPQPQPADAADAPQPKAEDWHNELRQLDEIEQAKDEVQPDPREAERAAKERAKAERKAEEERQRLERKAEEERQRAEEMMAKERAAAEKREAEERRRAEEEMKRAEKKAEEERRRAEKQAEQSRQKAEKEAEKERIKAEKKAAAMAAVAAREQAKADLMAQGKAEKEAEIQAALAEKQRKEAEKEVARREKERQQQAEADAKARQKAEKEAAKQAAKAEKEAAKRAEKAEKEAAKRAEKAEKEAAKQAEKNKRLADELLPTGTAAAATLPPDTADNDDHGRKRRVWPVVLVVLLLLGLGAAAYMLITRNAGQGGTTTAQADRGRRHLDVGNTNNLTFNTDLLSYSAREIGRNSDLVCRYMSEYINTYLADRNYTGARVPMMDRVRQYSTERMGTMMGERFAVQRLVAYDDYVYRYNEPWLRMTYADTVRHTVQGELMSYRALDDMLYRMVDELGLQPDGAGRKSAAEVKQVKANETKARTAKQPQGDAPVYVYVEKGSKQGFDIIAGFYLNKSTAAKQTARLHELGCDAYIIEFNDLYYVSMGSASSQTAADALLKHIKSWYDGDVVIKKW